MRAGSAWALQERQWRAAEEPSDRAQVQVRKHAHQVQGRMDQSPVMIEKPVSEAEA